MTLPTMPTDAPAPSGLTVNGIPVPLEIEAEGGAAIDSHVADAPPVPVPPVIEVAPNPPTHSEGVE